MTDEMDGLLHVIADGFVDTGTPGTVHPTLRREYGAYLMERFRDEGVTAAVLSDMVAMFELSAIEARLPPGIPPPRERLLELMSQRAYLVFPFLTRFLRLGLFRVDDDPVQWESLLLFLRRTAVLLDLSNASGPIDQPPPAPPLAPPPLPAGPRAPGHMSAAAPRQTVPVSARPADWYCIFCGWQSTQPGNDYICGGCRSLRPFLGGSATMIRCGACGNFSLAVARFCEWCGRAVRVDEPRDGAQ